jgi:hypothetical protein
MARKRLKQRAAVGGLGKALTRRSKGHCELCEGRGDVRPFELAPFPEEPVLERSLMACARCRGWLEGSEIRPMEAHFLSGAVWATEPAGGLAPPPPLLAVAPNQKKTVPHPPPKLEL